MQESKYIAGTVEQKYVVESDSAHKLKEQKDYKKFTALEACGVLLRITGFIVTIWGILAVANLVYLYILFHYSVDIQNMSRFFFAMFKWFWVNSFTYSAFDYAFSRDLCREFLEKYCGSHTSFLFAVNAVSLLVIPIGIQMVSDKACFYSYFVADHVTTHSPVSLSQCAIPHYSNAECLANNY